MNIGRIFHYDFSTRFAALQYVDHVLENGYVARMTKAGMSCYVVEVFQVVA